MPSALPYCCEEYKTTRVSTGLVCNDRKSDVQRQAEESRLPRMRRTEQPSGLGGLANRGGSTLSVSWPASLPSWVHRGWALSALKW